MAYILQFRDSRNFAVRAVPAWPIQRIVSISVIKVVLQLLVPSLVRYIWHSSHLYTVIGLLLVFVLECVLVKIYRLWTVILRRGLLVRHELIVDTFESAPTNLLCCEQFINCASVVCRSELEFLEVQERLGYSRCPCLELAVGIHVSVSGRTAIVFGWLADLVSLFSCSQLNRVRSLAIHLFSLIDVISGGSVGIEVLD